MLITQIIEAQVSLDRLEKFFSGEELDPNAVQENLMQDNALSIKNGTFEWDAKKPVLHNIDLEVPPGALVAVVGEVGSGKTSLLHAILGEIPKTSGVVSVKGSIAYVPQTAWIKNASVKDNITFMKPMDEKRYKDVIKVCQLQPDLAILTAGDQTEIGEKGINLSGGQKQRVSVARSVYSDADIYILDDPLSAVDAHVGKALFYDCIKGMLNTKTRILVTHQLQYLSDCDLIVVMKKGAISEIGTYDKLSKMGGEFSTLIEKFVIEKEQEQKKLEEEERKKNAEEKEKENEKESAKDKDVCRLPL
jgi:ATP-binding cassette subfamily C (CFTR/MRP) protein 1